MSKISRLLNLDYQTERRILSGKTIRPKNRETSILFFTIHKAASFYVNRIMRKLMKASRFVTANLEGYSFQHQSSVIQIQPELIQETGVYYGALRRYFQLRSHQKAKILVQVRDPRDAVTSSYFSFSKSHKAPVHEQRKQVFETTRANLSKMEIDEYVARAAMPVMQKLEHYQTDLFQRDQVLVMHYEDMVLDFHGWFDSLLAFLDLPGSARVNRAVDQIKREADFSVQKENKQQHKRQVVPGDHLRKLRPETIASLNETFSPYFRALKQSNRLPSNYEFPGTIAKAA